MTIGWWIHVLDSFLLLHIIIQWRFKCPSMNCADLLRDSITVEAEIHREWSWNPVWRLWKTATMALFSHLAWERPRLWFRYSTQEITSYAGMMFMAGLIGSSDNVRRNMALPFHLLMQQMWTTSSKPYKTVRRCVYVSMLREVEMKIMTS